MAKSTTSVCITHNGRSAFVFISPINGNLGVNVFETTDAHKQLLAFNDPGFEEEVE